MYYKVLKDGRIIDILTNLVYLKYQPKHNIMVVCSEDEAQAFLSSDENYIWHTSELYNIPVNGYDCVELIEIDKSAPVESVSKLSISCPSIHKYTRIFVTPFGKSNNGSSKLFSVIVFCKVK